jgi:hypothetical protein
MCEGLPRGTIIMLVLGQDSAKINQKNDIIFVFECTCSLQLKGSGNSLKLL